MVNHTKDSTKESGTNVNELVKRIDNLEEEIINIKSMIGNLHERLKLLRIDIKHLRT